MRQRLGLALALLNKPELLIRDEPVSVRWSGFPIPLGTGIAGTFFAVFAASASLGNTIRGCCR